MKTLYIIKVGDTFADLAQSQGDFEHWIERGLQPSELDIRVSDARTDVLPDHDHVAGVVMTGSHAMVSDRAAWSEQLAAWLRIAHAREIPLLGICYGHQLLAHALGGVVDYHPQGLEIGSVCVDKTSEAQQDPLFSALPEQFMANVIHRQSVRQLPDGAIVLAQNGFESHQAFRIGSSSWGVQFHPEFNEAAMRGYIAHLANDLRRDGADVEGLQQQVVATTAAAEVLQRFGRFAAHRT